MTVNANIDSGYKMARGAIAGFIKTVSPKDGFPTSVWGPNTYYPTDVVGIVKTMSFYKGNYTLLGTNDYINTGLIVPLNFGPQEDSVNVTVPSNVIGGMSGIAVRTDAAASVVNYANNYGMINNYASHFKLSRKASSYIEWLNHFAVSATGGGDWGQGVGTMVGLYIEPMARSFTRRLWGVLQMGTTEVNGFNGSVLIGDTTVANAGANKLYVNGTSTTTQRQIIGATTDNGTDNLQVYNKAYIDSALIIGKSHVTWERFIKFDRAVGNPAIYVSGAPWNGTVLKADIDNYSCCGNPLIDFSGNNSYFDGPFINIDYTHSNLAYAPIGVKSKIIRTPSGSAAIYPVYSFYADAQQQATNVGDSYGLYTKATNYGTGKAYALYADSGNVFVREKVGIGTSSPQFSLDVSGNTRISGNLQVLKNFTYPQSIASIGDGTDAFSRLSIGQQYNNSYYSPYIGTIRGYDIGTGIFSSSGNIGTYFGGNYVSSFLFDAQTSQNNPRGLIYFDNTNGHVFTVFKNGNFQLGGQTSADAGYKLDVNGTSRIKGISSSSGNAFEVWNLGSRIVTFLNTGAVTLDAAGLLLSYGTINGTFPNPQIYKTTASQYLSIDGSLYVAPNTDNILIGAATDNGYKLDVTGTARVSTLPFLASRDTVLTYDPDTKQLKATKISGGTGSSGYTAVQEDGSAALTARTNLNFGYGVKATDNSSSSRTDVDVELSNSETFLTSSVALTANTLTDIVSVSLGAGTWMIAGSATVESPSNAIQRVSFKVWDGTTTFQAGEASGYGVGGTSSSAKQYVCVPISCLVTLTGTTTVKLTVGSTAASTVLATPADNNTGMTSKATSIRAVRIK